jgi:hypothetical protein
VKNGLVPAQGSYVVFEERRQRRDFTYAIQVGVPDDRESGDEGETPNRSRQLACRRER